MRARVVERMLWGTALVAAASALAVSLLAAAPRVHDSVAAVIPLLPPPIDADTLEEAVTTIGAGNLFRAERVAAEPAAAAPAAGTMMMRPPSTKPHLVLRGTLGGPPWDAVIEGVPGHDGAIVVRSGQRIAGITVRGVRRDTALVRGFDTTWTLTIGRSW